MKATSGGGGREGVSHDQRERGQDAIGRQDQHEGVDESRRRRLAHPLGARFAVESAVTADHSDDRAEENALEYPTE